MTWKRLFRWFLRAALACLGLLVLIAGVVWYQIRADRTERWARSPEGRIAAALGWQQADDVEARLKAQPVLVLSLLDHDSKRVREAVQLFLTVHRGPLDDATLTAIAAEIRDTVGVERRFLVKLLAIQGKVGVRRIADFYRATQSLEPELQEAIERAVENPLGYSSDDLLEGLIKIVHDDTLMVGNRCGAAAALGYMRMPNARYEPNDAHFAALASLRDVAPRLPEPVAAAVRSALQRIADEEARFQERNVQQDDTREFKNLSADGGEAIAALVDPNDWTRVAKAADALARQGIKQAIPELKNVAKSHWYCLVRKIAEHAVRVLEGQEPYLPEVDESGRFKTPLQDLGWYLEAEIKEGSRRERSHSLCEEICENLPRVLHALRGYFLPRIYEIEYRRPGRLPRRMALEDADIGFMRPKCAVNFAGGKLLAYDAGEWGYGLVFSRKGEIPQYLAPVSATDFIPMLFGMLVLTEDGGVFVAKQSTDGSVNVVSLPKALPIGFGKMRAPQKMPNGELKIECIGVDVYITPTGDVRFVEQNAAGRTP